MPAGGSGYINYYAREGMQVRKNGSVYALDDKKTEAADVELSAEQLEKDAGKHGKNFPTAFKAVIFMIHTASNMSCKEIFFMLPA